MAQRQLRLTFPAPAIAQSRIEIAMVPHGGGFPGLGTGAQRFAKRLSDMTTEDECYIFAANERVKAFDSFDEVASGMPNVSRRGLLLER
ncbi:MAG: hypothetical protein Ct9H300mP28_10000 [Pseudomonadota bacterium]|nr:MAG: hypothetical protein Ct9H300mP28_10000 [Pseudomonadota bacterium]